MDVLTRKQRHKSMIGNKGNDTKPEILLRKALWHCGIEAYAIERIGAN